MEELFTRYSTALRSGHQLAAEGRFKEALTQYLDAAGVADQRAQPHIGVGGMHLRLGKPKDALAAYERALQREPENLDALSGKAAALVAQGRRADALAVQQQIVARRAGPVTPVGLPTDLQTPLSEAERLAMAGEEARATGKHEEAIAAWLGEARAHSAAGHYDAALDAALRALSLDTASTNVHLELTRICFERGWSDRGRERVAALRRLLELAPSDHIGAGLDQLEQSFATA